MCKNPPPPKRFLKNLSEKFRSLQAKYEVSGCSSINLFFQDESRFGLLTILRRMITARGVKPVAPFLHRFDNLYLFGAFSPITGSSCLLELPHCNSHTFQVFINQMATQDAGEFKIVILDNGAFHHAKSLQIPKNMALIFLPPYSPELNPAEKMWRHFKDKISMIAYHSLESLEDQLSAVIKSTTPSCIQSICGNEFYKQTFKYSFNV